MPVDIDTGSDTGIDEADLALSWTQLPPGPELGIQLALADWCALSDRELVAAMAAARRQASWAQGMQLEAVGELSRRRNAAEPHGGSDTHRRITAEISLELTVPNGQAEELLYLAETLPEELPHTWAALRTGQLDYDRAKVMADGVAGLSPELTRQLDTRFIGDAPARTKTQLRHRLNQAVKNADPDAHAARTRRAKNRRRVELWNNTDDTCDLIGRNLDATDAHAIFNRLTAAATAMQADGDTRPIDHIRLDLLRDLARGIPLPQAAQHLITDNPADAPHDTATDSDTVHRDTVHRDTVHRDTCNPTADRSADAAGEDVIAAVEQLIAQAVAEETDEQLTALLDRARAEGHLNGLAQLINHAVQTMRDALTGLVDSWCRTIDDDPATHGHHGYRPPAAMQRLIQRRHTTCGYPTCTRRSTLCDLDHTVPYHQGGHTCACNLAPLCRTHHRIIKQHPHWTLVQPWPGLLIWVTPTGTWHIVMPQ
jgi:uncharacterized protein DUF222